MQIQKNLLEKLSKIKMLVMDVDGTMTDSTVYYSKDGETLKRFSIRDGMGINLLHRHGIRTGIITSENSGIVTSRAAKLGIADVIMSSKNKKASIIEITQKYNLDLNEIAFIGDDVNDWYVIQAVAFGCCPADATDSIKEVVDFISKFNGGFGAIREICELILISQNKPIDLPEDWY